MEPLLLLAPTLLLLKLRNHKKDMLAKCCQRSAWKYKEFDPEGHQTSRKYFKCYKYLFSYWPGKNVRNNTKPLYPLVDRNKLRSHPISVNTKSISINRKIQLSIAFSLAWKMMLGTNSLAGIWVQLFCLSLEWATVSLVISSKIIIKALKRLTHTYFWCFKCTF